ncbi:MAG: hypothetical protein IT262_12670 [Saprospiraceae bacterium]|jgi:hypothetical protein|nr:hypothetical protein [Saprospiraceae bacterium]
MLSYLCARFKKEVMGEKSERLDMECCWGWVASDFKVLMMKASLKKTLKKD